MLKSTLIITVFTILSQIVSFVIQILIASHFGAGSSLDAYLAGITLPQYISTILTSTIVAVFIPVYISYNSKNNSEDAANVLNGILNIYFILSFIITVIGLIFASFFIEITVPGLSPEAKAIAYKTALIFWPSVLFSSLQALLISLYQANKIFFWQALTPVIGAICQLLLIYVLINKFEIYVLPFAALIGLIVPTLLLSKILLANKYKFKLFFHHPGVIEFIHLSIPLIIANIFIRIIPIVERFFASDMYTGSISHLNYAFKIVSVGSTILTIGMSTVIFPSLSEKLSNNNIAQFKTTISDGLKNMWILLAPIITFGLVLSLPAISLVFERGEFTHIDSVQVSKLFQIYLISLIGSSFGAITGKSLYALKLMKLISILGIIESIIYIIYTRLLVIKFDIYGLAIGYCLYFILSFCWHLILINFKTKKADSSIFSISFIKTLLCSIISGLIVWGITKLFTTNLLQVIFGILIGTLIYLGLLLLFKSEEALMLKERLLVPIYRNNKILYIFKRKQK